MLPTRDFDMPRPTGDVRRDSWMFAGYVRRDGRLVLLAKHLSKRIQHTRIGEP